MKESGIKENNKTDGGKGGRSKGSREMEKVSENVGGRIPPTDGKATTSWTIKILEKGLDRLRKEDSDGGGAGKKGKMPVKGEGVKDGKRGKETTTVKGLKALLGVEIGEGVNTDPNQKATSAKEARQLAEDKNMGNR